MYLSETHEKKWQPVLEHPDLPEIKDSYRRAVTSVILENQERAAKEDQASKIEDLEKKLNEQIEKNVALNKDNAEKSRKEIMAEVAGDLADTAKEKFAKLAEEIEWSDAESFKKKCETIKESYFGKKEEVKDKLDDVAAGDEASNEDLSQAMAAYTAAISKTKDIKLSNS